MESVIVHHIFKKSNISYEDLKPETNFFYNSGKIKLLDSFFVNGGKNSY